MPRLRKFLVRVLIVIAILAVTSPIWISLVARLAEPTIRAQLLGLAAEYVKPTLSIEKLEYSFPLHVKMINPRLTSTGSDGKPVDILTADEVGITLDRLPIFDGPLVFRDLDFENPVAKILVNKEGDVIGWGDFIKDSDKDSDGTSTADSSSDDRPISDIFAIDQINVEGLDFEYLIEGNDKPMMLKDLKFSLNNRGKEGAKKVELGKGPGWYEIDTRLTQGNFLDLKVNGGVNIDTLDVELDLVKMDLTLDKTSQKMLPPQVQNFIAAHQVEGRLDAELKGTFNIDDFLSSKTKMEMKLGPTHFAIDSMLISIDEASASGRTEKDTLLVEPIVIKALDGTMTGTLRLSDAATRGEPGVTAATVAATATTATAATATPTPTPPADVPQDPLKATPKSLKTLETNLDSEFLNEASLKKVEELAKTIDAFASIRIEDMKIQDLRRVDGGAPDRYAGEVDASMEVDLNLASPAKSLEGGGTVQISDGVLTGTDAWKNLATLMRIVVLNPSQKDRADLVFSVDDEKVHFSRMNLLAGAIGVRAKGFIGFNGNLHLDANAGPLEALQDSTGEVGSILGLLTDRLVKYIIRGKVGDSTVRVAPFGIQFLD
ncbi:MAG: hypothetical protein P8J59_09790 [Phycisphaerales bacterium]|nr:hypothetical protein [Phycisphaerales bacterium]